MSGSPVNTPTALRRLARGAAGQDARRPWLLGVELLSYMLSVGLGLLRESRADNADELAARASTAPYWIAAAVSIVVVGLTLARWRRPTRAGALAAAAAVLAAALDLLSGIGFGVLDSIWLGLASVAAQVALAAVVRRARWALALPVVVVAAGRVVYDVLATQWYDPGPDRFGGGRTLLLSVALYIAVAAAFAWLVPLVVGLVLRGADARRRAAALARMRTAERMQVARELHDLVANHVTGIITYTQAVGLRRDLSDEVHGMFAAIGAAGDDALAGMRRMVGALRSLDHDGAGGLDTVDAMPTAATDLRAAVRSATGEDLGPLRIVTRLAPELDSPPAQAPADVLTTVHRLVLEALTNVRRHAPHALQVTVTLDLPRPDLLRVEIRNDGARWPSRAGRRRGGGFGLIGLRERVTTLGGTIEHGLCDDDHWSVHAELPWTAHTDHTAAEHIPRPLWR